MNKRLKELAEQAGYPDSLTYGQEKVMEMFAELLEKEFEAKHFSEGYLRGQADGIKDTVLAACDKIESEYKYALGEKTQWAMAQDVQDLLKQHFGVEQ